MIKNNYIVLKTKGNRKLHIFKELGYDITDEKIILNIEHLNIGSRELVDVICDFCNKEVSITYKEYLRNISIGNKYACSKYCGSEKAKETNIQNIGVENHMQLKEIQEKVKITNLKKYGVEYLQQSNIMKEKSKKTCLDKYGYEHISQTEHFKKKFKETCLDKYGVEHYITTDDFKEKSKKTLFENYGVTNPSQSPVIQNTISENNLDKYGTTHTSKLDYVKIKNKKTSIERYGVDNVAKSDSIKKKITDTCLLKYGSHYYMSSNDFKEKSEKTLMKNFGVSNPTESYIIKKKIMDTCLLKYGSHYYMLSDDFKEKSKKTSIERYGVDNVAKSDSIKKKIMDTCLLKYGSHYYMSSNDFKEKSKKTLFENYGVFNPTESYIIKKKIMDTCLLKYGRHHYMSSDDFKEKSKTTLIENYNTINLYENEDYRKSKYEIANDINYIKYLHSTISLFNCDKEHDFEISSDNYYHRNKNNIPLCTVCNPIGDSKSIKEKNLLEFIQNNYQGEVISSYRDSLEIDIYLPELNIGFEFNGLYWHSSKFKDKSYHLDKTNYFKEKDIKIIHIWEDDWMFKQDIIKSQINNLLDLNTQKIFARKCYIKDVDSKIARKFLDDNHIQGMVNSSIKIGLYYNDELVSIMTFDSFEGRKKMEEGGYNLSRFCNKINANVVGGASKLLSYFIKNYDVKRIVSYADKDWSIGKLYYTLGFENIGGNGPDYKYIVDNKRVHKSRYKKSKLKTILTESKQMEKNGFLKVYDCGKIKFQKSIHKS